MIKKKIFKVLRTYKNDNLSITKYCNYNIQNDIINSDYNIIQIQRRRKMEKKKQIKISLKTTIILIIAILVVIGGIGIYCFNKSRISSYTNGDSTTIYTNSKNKIKGNEIEYTTKTGYYSGSSDCIENTFVTSYGELEKYVKQFETITIDNEDVLNYFDKDYFENHTLAIEAHDQSSSHNQYTIDNVTLNGTEANINITLTSYLHGGDLAPRVKFTFITLDKNITYAKFNINTKKVNNIDDYGTAKKPIIYLYPKEDTEVSVKLQYKDNITTSYPKYLDGWNVLAKKDGTLTDLSTNKNLYSLYYESENLLNFKVENDGFIVKGSDASTFLEEKLAMLGLTEREAEEFIIYWLPKLEANKYNYIRFATLDEINKNMPLEINPNPDTIIRVLMTYKGLETPIDITEQQLETPTRTGFVAVEWGGTEIK